MDKKLNIIYKKYGKDFGTKSIKKVKSYLIKIGYKEFALLLTK